MNYSKYYPIDVLNGEGTRCSLFVSGCIHNCRGCYNQSIWSPNAGDLFTEQLADQIITDLNDRRIKKQGLSLSGGDPLHPANIADVLSLVLRVKKNAIIKIFGFGVVTCLLMVNLNKRWPIVT